MSNRVQWRLFIAFVSVLFFAALIPMLLAKPRDVRLGSYSTQNAAVAAALNALRRDAQSHPMASTITVHFSGPHPAPEGGEEAFSYNRRLGVLIAFVNRESGSKRTFVKLLCPKVDAARLQQLARQSDILLASPQNCGCKLEKPNQLG